MKRPITFTGYDPVLGSLEVPVINIWKRHKQPCKAIFTVAHGSDGLLLRRKGDMCQVRIGTRKGWVKYGFIRELREEWIQKRPEIVAAMDGFWKIAKENMGERAAGRTT